MPERLPRLGLRPLPTGVWRFWLNVSLAALWATTDHVELDHFCALYDALHGAGDA